MITKKVSIVLGAGFSYVAGLPLTSQLFSTTELPPVRSRKDEERMLDVLLAFKAWGNDNPSGTAEEWLRVLYTDKNNPLSNMIHRTTWENAVGFGLRRLTTVKNAHPEAYYYGISRYDPDAIHQIHKDFWKFFQPIDARRIITLNYDLLVERALHGLGSNGKPEPLFSYGGFPYRQIVRKMMNVTTRSFEDVVLGTDYLIYKLHGSLNWAQERHSNNMKMHDDVRAVFRTTDSVGVPAIVPPIPEKELPEQFARIWSQAAVELKTSIVWVVCGYSMPEYDEALRKWFRRILSGSEVQRIAILDPDSNDLAHRWRHKARKDIEVRAFPGLPDCLSSELRDFVGGK